MSTASLSAEQSRARLERYGLQDVVAELPQMPELGDPETVISGFDEAWRDYFFQVTPKDIAHLRLLAGVPSSAARDPLYECVRKQVAVHELRAGAGVRTKLGAAEERSLYNAAHNVLFGAYADEALEREPLAGVCRFMLEAAAGMSVFAAKDLVVGDGRTVRFTEPGTLYFNSVQVYGSGEIVLEAQIKIVANSIEYFMTE